MAKIKEISISYGETRSLGPGTYEFVRSDMTASITMQQGEDVRHLSDQLQALCKEQVTKYIEDRIDENR